MPKPHKRRAVAAWLGTPLGVTLLWLAAETFASEMPGTALVIGLIGFAALIACVGFLFYVFHE